MIRAAIALWAITYSAALAPAITGPDKPDGQTTIWREKNGVRLVILLPDQPSGARLMVTAYKIKGPASAKRC